MKNITLILVLLFCSIFAFAQNTEKENLIKLDSIWGKEVFPFPIAFAQNIKYTGIAEVRFPPKGWINPEHPFLCLTPMFGVFILIKKLLRSN